MKRIIVVVCILAVAGSLMACSVQKISTDKIRDLEFSVVTEEIPDELREMIASQKGKAFKLTYADQGMLYITEGYGKQSTSGYSIEVTECYESSNAVYFHSNLIGPSKEERIVEKETYPYVVIQIEFTEKHVVFM